MTKSNFILESYFPKMIKKKCKILLHLRLNMYALTLSTFYNVPKTYNQ